MKKFSKYLVAFTMAAFLTLPVLTMAQSNIVVNEAFGFNPVNNGLNGTLGETDPRKMVGSIINVALGFMGVIAVIIILIGGFKWMTAGGNEDKVAEAKKMLGYGVIGMVIVLAAWGVATFVVNSIYQATVIG